MHASKVFDKEEEKKRKWENKTKDEAKFAFRWVKVRRRLFPLAYFSSVFSSELRHSLPSCLYTLSPPLFLPPSCFQREHLPSLTMVDNSQEYRLRYWATRSSICLFARTAHSFACSRLLASLAPSAALTRSLARSLRSLLRSWERDWLDGYFVCVLFYFGP